MQFALDVETESSSLCCTRSQLRKGAGQRGREGSSQGRSQAVGALVSEAKGRRLRFSPLLQFTFTLSSPPRQDW